MPKLAKKQHFKKRLFQILKNEILKKNTGAGQRKTAETLGLTQSQISAITNMKIAGFSLDRIMFLLHKLDKSITITIGDIELQY